MILMPLFSGYADSGLYDTRVGMIIVYTAISVPFSAFVMRNFFTGIARSVFEAAIVDGGGLFRIFRSIYLPMAGSALAAIFILQATFVWNDLLLGLTLSQSDSVRPIMPALTGLQSTYGGAALPTVLAGGLLVSLPTVIFSSPPNASSPEAWPSASSERNRTIRWRPGERAPAAGCGSAPARSSSPAEPPASAAARWNASSGPATRWSRSTGTPLRWPPWRPSSGARDGIAVDVGDRDALWRRDAAAGSVRTAVDVLVCAAGIQRYGTVVDTPPSVFDEVMAVNVGGVFFACSGVRAVDSAGWECRGGRLRAGVCGAEECGGVLDG